MRTTAHKEICTLQARAARLGFALEPLFDEAGNVSFVVTKGAATAQATWGEILTLLEREEALGYAQ